MNEPTLVSSRALNCRSDALNITEDSIYEQSLAWCCLHSTIFDGKNGNIASPWVLPEQIDMVRRQHPGVVALRHNRQKYCSIAALVRCDWLGSDSRTYEKTRSDAAAWFCSVRLKRAPEHNPFTLLELATSLRHFLICTHIEVAVLEARCSWSKM